MQLTRVLTRDDKGKDVKWVSEKLIAQGFFAGPPTERYSAALESSVSYFQQTHLGQNGKPLGVDGNAGPKTGWALAHPTGKAQKSNLAPTLPKGLTGVRHDILSCAIGEHAKGVKEIPNGSNRSKYIDKYFPAWLLKKLGPKEKGPAWCAFFVNKVVTLVMKKRPWGGYLGSCSALWKAAKKTDKCVVYEHGDRPIRPGDVGILLRPDPATGANPKSGHIFFVLRVSKDGKKVNTVEGNCGNRVKVGVRDVQDVAVFVDYILDDHDPCAGPLLRAANVGKEGTR